MKLKMLLKSLPSDKAFTITFMNTPSKKTHSLCPISHIIKVCTIRLGHIVAASFMAKHEAGYSFFEADTCKQLAKSDIPTLFIHAKGDSYVPWENVYELFNAANEPKELYTVPEADHVCACFYDKKTYFEKIFDFLDKYM